MSFFDIMEQTKIASFCIIQHNSDTKNNINTVAYNKLLHSEIVIHTNSTIIGISKL